jgi:putative resolvase
MYITAKEVKEKLGITSQTLYNWRKLGKIKYKELNSRNFLYDIDSIGLEEPKYRKNVVYARVSNTKQKDDLENQISIISQFMAAKGLVIDEIYKDIASGMNENRKDFNKLINEVTQGKIDTIYISYKDRLTRFGYGYLEKWFGIYDTNIVYINFTKEEDFQTELTEDLISIIHHFSMKMYSNRRKVLKLTEQNLKSINN